MTYTAFCQEADGTGTIWISTVEGNDPDEAKAAAVDKCCADWGGEECGFTAETVACLGLAEGDVKIVHWEDIGV